MKETNNITKVAIISPGHLPIPTVKGGGVETLIQQIIDENENENKLEITLYTIDDKKARIKSQKYKKTNIVFIKRNKLLNSIIKFRNRLLRKILSLNINDLEYYAKKICKDIKINNYDKIIVENNLYIASYITNTTNQYFGQLYFHLHNDDINLENELDVIDSRKKILDKYYKIITVSNFIGERVNSVIKNKEKIEVLRNCIDIDKFKKDTKIREKKREEFGIGLKDVVIMYTGRVIKEKGVKELLLACRELNQDIPFKLVIVGSSWYGVNKSDQFIQELSDISESLKDKVIFTGFLPYEEIPSVYQVADIVVVPTMYVEDAAPLTVIETMASSLPIIVTDSGGILEYIDMKGSYIVRRDTDVINELKEAIEKLLLDKSLRESKGKINREKAEKFNVKRYYDNFVKILER